LTTPTTQPVHEMGITVDEVPSRSITLTNVSFAEILGVDVNPRWRGGSVVVSGLVHDGTGLPTLYRYALVDVRVVAYQGAVPVTLARGAVGYDAGGLVVVIADVTPYSRISVLARQLVDGGVNATVFAAGQGPVATVGATLRFNRQ